MIQIRDLCKSYGSLRAVDGLSFDVSKGETFGLLGPNGAGKSTTIAVLIGALKADSGQLAVAGHDVGMDPQARRQVGVAPQANAVYGDLSGRENATFFGRIYGLRGAMLTERVGWSLEFVGLADRAYDLVRTYSGGMKRRLNLACALVHDPEVIVLDEPTVGVDPQSRNRIFENIEELKRLGRTILYTTHYMEEVERLCDRVGIVDQGKLVALGTVDELVAKHGGEGSIELRLKPMSEPIVAPAGTTLVDGRLTKPSKNPGEDFAKLVATGLQFDDARIVRPNLETVFLNLTGRTLRDA